MNHTEYTVRVYADHTEWRNAEWLLHRTDGPAIENINGYKAWYLNGRLHRTDGPAVIYADGDKSWFLEGLLVTELAHAESMRQQSVTIDGWVYQIKST